MTFLNANNNLMLTKGYVSYYTYIYYIRTKVELIIWAINDINQLDENDLSIAISTFDKYISLIP